MATVSIPIKPVSGPPVWQGDSFAGRDDWVFHLTAPHLAEIEAAVAGIPITLPDLYTVTAADFPLSTLAPALHEMDNELQQGRGFILLRGLPVDRYTEEELAAIFWGIGAQFGIGQAQSRKGDRLGHVIDRSGPGSEVRHMRNYEVGGHLRMHTDLNNDVVGLLMFQHARSGGESRIASSMTVHNIILDEHPEYLEPLYRGYYFHVLRGDQVGDSKLSDHRIPIFIDHGDAVSCHYNPSPIDRSVERAGVQLTETEAAAVRFVAEVAARPGIYLDMKLQPGDIQLLNNHVIMHGRTDYEDYPESERRRHLLRLWLRSPNARKQPPETQVYQTDEFGYRFP
ncbi:MAG: TauD/TfdA family dioxygenase [Rhodospirillaceae bacterium]|jgi:hypothetical protein|nr:TauD/TfdA family dioxygenase [Rhodospirillaceae bacterium]